MHSKEIEIIEDWVARLRNGKYKQTSARLRNTNGETGEKCHCCLGVLGEACVDAGLCKWNGDVLVFGQYEGTALLPHGLTERLGLGSANTTIYVNGGEDSHPQALHIVNDAHGKTFTEIAEMVEETFLKPKA